MSLVKQEASKRLLAVHGWSGVILGLFLYVVVVTGAIAVFAHEIGEWSNGGVETHAPLNQPLDAKIQELARTVDKKYLEDVSIFANTAGSVQVFFHTHGTNSSGDPDDLGVRYLLAPGTLEVLSRDEGFGSDMPDDPQSALERFITELHINLHAPRPWGLYLTGILGFVMLAAVVSGIILHKHILRDIFVAPRFSSLLLNRRDRHILAGSWSLPFGFILAFTGAFFSFAGAIGLPLVAMVSFGGDQVKMIETLVGVPEHENEAPAEMANLDTVIGEATERAGNAPSFVAVIHWGAQDAKLNAFHPPAEGEVEGSSHIFDMATGEYLGTKPPLGTEPSAGGTAFAWMGPLHFGHFGGLLSKVIWVCLGLATCYVTLTGLQLWVQRRQESSAWRMLSRGIPIVGYGVPIGLVGAADGRGNGRLGHGPQPHRLLQQGERVVTSGVLDPGLEILECTFDGAHLGRDLPNVGTRGVLGQHRRPPDL